MFGRSRLTLSLETNEVRLLVARGERILRWGSRALPEGAVRNGQIAQPGVFGDVVSQALDEVRGPKRRAVVSLPGHRALVRILKLPPVPDRLLAETVRRKARRELPLPLDELYLSWQVISNHDAAHLQTFTLGIPQEAIDHYVAGLRSTGVRPVDMDLKALALVRAVNRPDLVIADLEAETALVVLVRGFVPQIVRSVAPPGGPDQPLADRAADLVSEVQRILDFYASTRAATGSALSPTVCLTGALGAEPEVQARLASRWSLVAPQPPLSLPEDLPLLPYLVNVGLVLKGRGQK